MHQHLCRVVWPLCSDFLTPAKKSQILGLGYVKRACLVSLFGSTSSRGTEYEDVFRAEQEALEIPTATFNKSNSRG